MFIQKSNWWPNNAIWQCNYERNDQHNVFGIKFRKKYIYIYIIVGNPKAWPVIKAPASAPPPMKRSRGRVKIGGKCYFFLQNSLRIKEKVFFFLDSQHYRMNHILQDLLLNPWKIVKIWETRTQSSKNAPTWTKNCKIHDVDKSTLVFGFL